MCVQLLSLGDLLHFASVTRNFNLLQSSIILVMTILKHTTLPYPSGPEEGGSPDPNLHMIASPECIQSILRGMLACLRVASSGGPQHIQVHIHTHILKSLMMILD